MHLASLRLRDFRNYAQLDIEFTPGFHLILGPNGQGKTNLLEAIYLLGTLRSFRGVGSAQLVRHGQDGFFIGASVVGRATHQLKVYWSAAERKLSVDGKPVKTLSEYWGLLRSVVFSSEDVQLVKGPASRRRRFLDLLIAQVEAGYLAVLQRYARALRARNAMLRRGVIDAQALESFSRELVQLGVQIIERRSRVLPQIAPMVQRAYDRISGSSEALRVEYSPSVRGDFAVALAQSRDRESLHRATVVGPHRDEVKLLLNDRSALQFGSEGQKRSLAIALKMAQAEFLSANDGVLPVLLIDDVLGELDVHRRGAFIPLLDEVHRGRGQVFMTATEEAWPREVADRAVRWEIRSATVVRQG